MSAYTKMLPHLENGCYDYDFWNVMRGKTHNENLIGNGKETSTGTYHMSTMSNTKYVTALQKESIFRQLGTCINAYAHEYRIFAKEFKDIAEWVPEGEAVPINESANDFNEKVIGSHKLAVFVKSNADFIHDATFNIEAYLTDRLAKNFGRAEEKAFITGTGKNMPTGILADKEGADIGVTTKAITYDDVVKLYFSVKPEYRKRGVWMMNDETAQALRTLKDDGGNYIWNHTNDTIMGKRVVISEFMPSAESGAKPIAFGDFRYYWVVTRRPLSVRCLTEQFVTQDQVGHLAFEFLDGKLVRLEAIKVLQMTA